MPCGAKKRAAAAKKKAKPKANLNCDSNIHPKVEENPWLRWWMKYNPKALFKRGLSWLCENTCKLYEVVKQWSKWAYWKIWEFLFALKEGVLKGMAAVKAWLKRVYLDMRIAIISMKEEVVLTKKRILKRLSELLKSFGLSW